MVEVSIIIPIYNIKAYINQCVYSIVTQTHKNIEIILVDDGSTDGSGTICDSLAKKDKRIIVIHKKNGGLSDARNAGIKKATGDFIIFVDGDDMLMPRAVEVLLSTIRKDHAQIAICNRKRYYDQKNRQYINDYPNDASHLLMNKSHALVELCSFNLFDMSAWAKIYQKNLFDKIKFPINKLSEDYYIMYQLFDQCDKIAYINQPLYIYRQRQGSISKNSKINYDYPKAAKEQMLYIERKYPQLKKYAHSAYVLSVINICNQYLENRNSLPPKEEYLKLKTLVRPEQSYIQNNEKLSHVRKLQIRIFLLSRHIYGQFYKIYKKMSE